MSFPVIESVTHFNSDTQALPAHNSGDMFILLLSGYYFTYGTPFSGATVWAYQVGVVRYGASARVYYVVSDGSLTTVDVDRTAGAEVDSAHMLIHLSNVSGNIESVGSIGSNTTRVWPPEKTASWGAKDNLFIGAGSRGGNAGVGLIATYPSSVDQNEENYATSNKSLLMATLRTSAVATNTFWRWDMDNAGSSTQLTLVIEPASAAGDVTAPVLSSPTGVDTSQTTADVSVTTDESNGTLYWVVTQSATAPSALQIQAGQDHTGAAAAAAGNQAVSGGGVNSASVTGLSDTTTYYAHFQHVDAAANESNLVTSASFATPSYVPPALSLASGTGLSNVTAELSVTTDNDTGVIYWVVTESAVAPSVAQIKAGQDELGAAAVSLGSIASPGVGANTDVVDGLTRNTTYYAYFVHADSFTNDSLVAETGAFLTLNISTLTTDPLVNNAGGLRSGLVDLQVFVYDVVTGALVFSTTTGTTDGAGVLQVDSGAMVAATEYRVVISDATATQQAITKAIAA